MATAIVHSCASLSKNCFKCGQIKPLTEFYRHPEMADGHVNKCKECNKKDVRTNCANNKEYYQAYEKSRANLPHRVQSRLDYAQTESGKMAAARARRKWLQNNPHKRHANVLLGNAVRNGNLTKPASCSECGKSKCRIHGHHDDYSKPLDVRWLCAACHSAWHKENTPLGL